MDHQTLPGRIEAIANRVHQGGLSVAEQLTTDIAASSMAYDFAMDDLDAALNTIEQQLAEAVGKVEASAAETAGTAVQHETRLNELSTSAVLLANKQIDQLHADVAAIGSAKGTASAALTAAVSGSDASVIALGASLTSWAGAATEGAAAAEVSLMAFQATQEQALASCTAACNDVQATCRSLSGVFDQRLNALSAEWSNHATQLVQGTSELMLTHVGGAMNGDVREVMDQLDVVRSASKQMSGLIGGDAARLLDSARAIVDLVKQIKPLLDLANQLS